MRFQTEQEAITYLFRSRHKGKKRGLEEVSRDVSSTRKLLLQLIVIEHAQCMGDSLERNAWRKSGREFCV